MIGITGLQLYWNYQNYKSVVDNFKKDANNALEVAVDKELELRQQKLTVKFREWLADTSIINIECNINNRDSNTVFTVRDVHPRFLEDTSRKEKFYDFGIASFKQKLKKITPQAKQLFIDFFAEKIFKEHIKTGTIFYYTQCLGDSITKAFDGNKLNANNLASLYKQELAQKDIYSVFQLSSKNAQIKTHFTTAKINTALTRPHKKEYIFASLENPSQYYLREMKWLIIGSVLLIGITVFCFYYTIKTLLNQHKLVDIKNQFISNMTHEINTPLASIQVTAEALQKFKPNEETATKYLDIILYQTRKLNELSNEILENAKLETLNFKTNEQVDLKQVINDVLADFTTELRISANFDEGEFKILGNKSHLYRSITNLIENAVKYNTSANPAINISLFNAGGNICLSIKDNGPGIADEFKSKIFDQFYRIPTGNMHDVKGYGLGLSYVKKVISQHKGSISVVDNQPSGTIFSLTLPA